jgi:nucleoside phosphorylase
MRIDFAVIATLDEEFDAVKRIFQLQEKDLKSERNFLYYYKKIGDCGVAFFKFTSQGNLNSSSQTTQIIQNFNPRFIIFVGIAGGFKNRINIGDVAVSDIVLYYPYQDRSEKGAKPELIPTEPPSRKLKDLISHIKDEWKNRIKTSRPDGIPITETKVKRGLFLSGEAVVNLPEEKIKEVIPSEYLKMEPIAIDTEAGGVSMAVYNVHGQTEYIVIKGISDYANVPESQEQRGLWKNYASEVAAAFTYELIVKASELVKQEPYIPKPQNVYLVFLSPLSMVIEFKSNAKVYRHGYDVIVEADGVTYNVGMDLTVSRRTDERIAHLIINREDNRVYVKDLGSTNGTYIDGVKIEPYKSVEVRPNSTITIGYYTTARIDYELVKGTEKETKDICSIISTMLVSIDDTLLCLAEQKISETKNKFEGLRLALKEWLEPCKLPKGICEAYREAYYVYMNIKDEKFPSSIILNSFVDKLKVLREAINIARSNC